jgi:hypothetical protein
MNFYAAVIGANIGYAIGMLLLGEYGLAAFNSGLAVAMIGVTYYYD